VNLIPEKYRIAAVVLLFVVACLASAFAGSVVGEWKSDAGHASELLTAKNDLAKSVAEKQALELALADQSKAVAVASARSEGAEQAASRAEAFAEQLGTLSKSRMDKIESFIKTSTAKDCKAVLGEYWELRK